MRNDSPTMTVHPLFLGPDLLIELGRLQFDLDDCRRAASNEPGLQASLETRRALLSAAFDRFNHAGEPAY